MSALRLKIACDNAAFEGDPATECARILEELAEKLQGGGYDGGRLYDFNGNHVGDWSIK